LYWTDKLFLHEKPQFVSVKGTTKKADAFGLFVYPNSVETAGETGISQTAYTLPISTSSVLFSVVKCENLLMRS
jgi:hypothetical protein